MMRGMFIPVDGSPFSVIRRRDWNTSGALESALNCHSVVQLQLPPHSSTTMALFLPADAYLIAPEINDQIMGLLAGEEHGLTLRGNALFVGYSPKSGRRTDLALQLVFRVGRRLLEAKQLV